jgi:hypothetical protein
MPFVAIVFTCVAIFEAWFAWSGNVAHLAASIGWTAAATIAFARSVPNSPHEME